jgi:hypothetical protein
LVVPGERGTPEGGSLAAMVAGVTDVVLVEVPAAARRLVDADEQALLLSEARSAESGTTHGLHRR